MKKDILNQYYKGIHGQINSKVQQINQLFNHNGLKGEGNEHVIRDLIRDFLPKKYGIGSGIIIDKNGNQSRQCDIIIYDNHNYPELLSMSSSKFYPIDIVYLFIEVKTTLNKNQSKISIQNIDSVLKLDYIKELFRTTPTEPIGKDISKTILFEERQSTPPIGIVFSYNTTTNNLNTFMKWFMNDNDSKNEYFPSHICSLDQGILVLNDNLPIMFPIVKGDEFQTTEDNYLVKIRNKKFYYHDGDLCPYTKVGEEEVLVDQGKTLLNFILLITKLLDRKHLIPNIDFRKYYLSENLKVMFSIKNDKLLVL